VTGEALPGVLFVDDDAELLATLSSLAEASERMALAGTATSGAAALKACTSGKPDVVVADVRMPGTDGLGLTRALLRGRTDARPRVLVMTAFACDGYLTEALGAGARGFLSKTATWPELEEAVETVHKGGIALQAEFTARLVDLLLPGQVDLGELSPRELEVLRLVGMGASLQEIACALHMAEGTARGHMEHLRRKLRATNRAGLAVAARSAGLGLGSA
jgi:DNA-binding NarL/FixJ family response regulator